MEWDFLINYYKVTCTCIQMGIKTCYKTLIILLFSHLAHVYGIIIYNSFE